MVLTQKFETKHDFLNDLDSIVLIYNSPPPQAQDTTYNLGGGEIPFPKEEVKWYTPEEAAKFSVVAERESKGKTLTEMERRFLWEYRNTPHRISGWKEGKNLDRYGKEKEWLRKFYDERDKRESIAGEFRELKEKTEEWIKEIRSEREGRREETKKAQPTQRSRPQQASTPRQKEGAKTPGRKNLKPFRNLAIASALGAVALTTIVNPDLAAEYIPLWNSTREKREIAQEHYDDAGNLWKRSRLEQAEQSLEEAVRFNPKIDGSGLLAAISASRKKSERLEAEGDGYFSRGDYRRAAQKYVAAGNTDRNNYSIYDKVARIDEARIDEAKERKNTESSNKRAAQKYGAAGNTDRNNYSADGKFVKTDEVGERKNTESSNEGTTTDKNVGTIDISIQPEEKKRSGTPKIPDYKSMINFSLDSLQLSGLELSGIKVDEFGLEKGIRRVRVRKESGSGYGFPYEIIEKDGGGSIDEVYKLLESPVSTRRDRLQRNSNETISPLGHVGFSDFSWDGCQQIFDRANKYVLDKGYFMKEIKSR